MLQAFGPRYTKHCKHDMITNYKYKKRTHILLFTKVFLKLCCHSICCVDGSSNDSLSYNLLLLQPRKELFPGRDLKHRIKHRQQRGMNMVFTHILYSVHTTGHRSGSFIQVRKHESTFILLFSQKNSFKNKFETSQILTFL